MKKESVMKKEEVLNPIANVVIIKRDKLKPNDYNPNVVNKRNMDLLLQSILANGWTMPIVIKKDGTIIDGYHRWLLAGQEPLKTILDGFVPVVYVGYDDKNKEMFGTITHNRARGVHQLGPMKAIIKKVLASGKEIPKISKELGMSKEEIFRLSDFSRDDFLSIMTKGSESYSKAVYYVNIRGM